MSETNSRERFSSLQLLSVLESHRKTLRGTAPAVRLVFRVADVREAWHYLKQARKSEQDGTKHKRIKRAQETLEQFLDEL